MATGLEIQHKRDFHILRWVTVVLVFAMGALLLYFGYRWYMTGEQPPIALPAIASADPGVDETPVTDKQIAAHKVGTYEPRYLSIPKLGITKTRIMQVGITSNGLLDVPDNINDVAWYTKSMTPGTGTGAVLIDGHNGGISRDGVFARLKSLVKGDEIVIERGDGKLYTYQVYDNISTTLEEVNKSGMRRMMYSADSSKEGLNLITCDGNWVPRYKQFDRRILLRAVAT